MGLISELFKALDEQDLKRVGQLKLTKTERNLFNQLVETGEEEAPGGNGNFSDGYLRKVRSALYDKTLQTICESDLELIDFFVAKRLFKNLTHWVLKIEKRLVKEGSFDQLKTIYRKAARAMVESAIPDAGVPFVEDLEEKFARHFPEDQVNHQLIKSFRLYMQIGILREFPDKKINIDLDGEIDGMLRMATELDDPNLKLWAANLKLNRLHPDALEEKSKVKHRINELLETYSEELSQEDKISATFRNILLDLENSRFEEAFADVEQFFENHPAEAYSRFNFSIFYCQLCIILGHYEKGQAIMLKANGITHLDEGDENSSEYNFSFIYFSLINLLQGNYNVAFDQIRYCQQTIEKTHFFWMNAIVKILENSYFLLTKQYELADNLAVRHIKFYNNHKDNPDLLVLKDFHSIVRFCLREKEQGGELPEQYHEAYKDFNTGGLAFIGALVNKVLKVYGITPPDTVG